MATPKSVVKFTKNGVEFISSVDRAQYYLFELTRAALRDVCRYVRKQYRTAYYHEFKRHTGEGPRAISYTVYSGKNTEVPRANIGIRHASPGHTVRGFYSYFHEVGTVKEPKHGLLQRIVEAHIGEIRLIEAQYLSAISTDEAQSLIESEDDYESRDD